MEKPMREDIEFDAEGVTLRGWFYSPDDASGGAPCVVMTHGFSCTKEMGLL
jgi:poly(3-hydroxybutyrate) depolymerase